MKTHQLINNLKTTRHWVRLSPQAQLLFFELAFLYFYSKEPGRFSCTNTYLCNVLNISEKTLLKARRELVEAGLLFFEKGTYRFGQGQARPLSPEAPETGKTTGISTGKTTGVAPANINYNNNIIYIQKEKINKKEKVGQAFEEFRRRYPGRKRGLDTELNNFIKKHDDYEEALPQLLPAVERLIRWHDRQLNLGRFVPDYPLMQTWINQRRWEEQLPQDNVYE